MHQDGSQATGALFSLTHFDCISYLSWINKKELLLLIILKKLIELIITLIIVIENILNISS
jgi:hypothetical protein